MGTLGSSSTNVDMSLSDAGSADTFMTLVRVDYSSDSGFGNFEAIKYTTFGQIFYIPRTGSVDLTDNVAFVSETIVNASLDGGHWSDFGFNTNRVALQGTSNAEVIEGETLSDLITGAGGNDTVLGGMGDDKIFGGGRDDLVFGGVHSDILFGDAGRDTVLGGIGNDTLHGGIGDDRVEGFYGNDHLFGNIGKDSLSGGADDDDLQGGAGRDQLMGNAGSDTLRDGAGVDNLTGGAGADVFVMTSDGTRDTIRDFHNGVDRISLSLAFGALTITNIAPGEERIVGGSDHLIVFDLAGTLTAADFI